VLKLSRMATLNRAVEQEQRALSALRAGVDPVMQASFPEPLGTFRWRDLLVGVESCADGRPLSTSRQGVGELREVAAWITRLHVEAPIEHAVWGEALVEHWLADPLARYAERFGLTSGEQRVFDAVRARARELFGQAIPLVWTHWGFGPQNIFRHERGLVVIDWEGGSPGLPGLDLLHYVAAWSFIARKLRGRGAELHGVRELFCEPQAVDAACAAAREVIREYLRRLGVDERFLPVLLVVVWVFRALGQPADLPRSANRYVDYLGGLAACSAWLAPNQ
jgi:aminoglycoside phosphotransferase (APT) family kinase protein